MTQKFNLKSLEKKAWTSYFQDGLLDIFFGLMMVSAGVRAVTIWSYLIMVAAVLVLPLGKTFITIPRMGNVKFRSERMARQKKVMFVIGIALLATAAVLVITLLGNYLPPKEIRAAVQGIMFILIFSAIAYFMDFNRLYIYGLLFAVGAVLWELFGIPAGPVAFIVSGIVALTIGLIYLVKFLLKYSNSKGIA
jgi:hypothetical protein